MMRRDGMFSLSLLCVVGNKEKEQIPLLTNFVFINFVCQCAYIHREFLTGFHKRKLEKQEAAKKRAMEKEKIERLETRREVRSTFNIHPLHSFTPK